LDVDLAFFPSNLTVSREKLQLSEYCTVTWRVKCEEGNKKADWIVITAEMSEELFNDGANFINALLATTKEYKHKLILLTKFKEFCIEQERLLQKRFAKAVKDQRRFSGNMTTSPRDWLHAFTLSALHHSVHLQIVGSNGAHSSKVEAWLVESSKALAWNALTSATSTMTVPAKKPVRCGKDQRDTYIKMLKMVPRMSAVVIDAVLQKYPTMKELLSGLQKEGAGALERLLVSEERSVGRAMSEKIFYLFTSDDLNRPIN
jgi:hypothetical protein